MRVKVVKLDGYNPGVTIEMHPKRAEDLAKEKKVIILDGAKSPNKQAPKAEEK